MGNTQVQPPAAAFCELDPHQGLSVVQLYLMPSFFLAVLILGLPLNLLSIWVFSHRLRRWTRSTVFLFNLTLADFSWLLALPFLIHYHLNHLCWTLGLPLCTAVRMLYHNYFYLSIFFVTCISVDRYVAIVHPLRSLVLLGRRQTCLLCAALWALCLLLSVPVATMTLIQTCPGSNRTVCTLYILLNEPRESLPYSLSCSVFGFLFPLLCICYCGLRSVKELRRRPDPHNKQLRLRRLLSTVLVLFALFYLPYHLSRNVAGVMRAVYPDNPASWRPADMAFSLEMCFCGLITCVNPLFSCFIGRQFRKEFYGTFAGMFPHCAGLQVDSLVSKRSRMTPMRRQRMSAVTPVNALPAPRP
ncbi:succinate receptor 1-like [Stegastes partitus]|uniref:Succinate receptor 1-like n=1 Tax=Stegastes partitus TaxID=144197 RepID=A0A9Y4KFD6_9TELE|nr:PREDICTED: succinate receptor 1-like [Stegastes partitus]